MNIQQSALVLNFLQIFVERCKYLEESKCVGICINTCKLSTQVSVYKHGIVQFTCNLGAFNLEFLHSGFAEFLQGLYGGSFGDGAKLQ